MEPLDKRLAERSKEELIALVKEMIAQQPELARLLDLPLRPGSSVPLDLDVVCKQVGYALAREDAEWAGRELRRLAEMADRYLEAGSPETAGALYHLILAETLSRFEDWWLDWDRGADIQRVLGDCAEGLEQCLEQVSDPAIRRPWLEALLEAKLEDTRLGGVDFAWPAGEVVLRQATDEEWGWIEARVQQEIQKARDWAHGVLVEFINTRLAESGREAEAEAFTLAQGTPSQQAFLLVRLDRVEEAVEIARQHFTKLPGLVIDFANALVEAGHGEVAAAYMVEQSRRERFAGSYLSWLARYFEEHGDRPAALDARRRQFEESPELETYRELRRLAGELGTWPSLRPALLNMLDPIRQARLLLDIALDEGDVAWGLEIASRRGVWLGREAYSRLAQAAEADHPRAALEIYRSLAEQTIAARDRGNYRAAAGHLLRVRELYRGLDEEAAWQTYIAGLREGNRRLRALREELDRVGL